MKFKIIHEIEGRMRIDCLRDSFTLQEADTIQYCFERFQGVKDVKVYLVTSSVAISYKGDRQTLIRSIQEFSLQHASVPEVYLENSTRKLDVYYQNMLMNKIIKRYAMKLLMPKFLGALFIWKKSLTYGYWGLKSLWNGRLDVSVLDGSAIMASVLRNDRKTASSVIFLLEIGEILEEWTHKKSVADLARSMSLDTPRVWKVDGSMSELVDSKTIQAGDFVRVYKGSVIPFDGICESGEAMVNQASLTGEALPVRKIHGVTCYAGTIVEEGELVLKVSETSGASRYEKIVEMIEETEKLKSSIESEAEHLADRFVPYSLSTTILVYLFTRNITKALSVLMVDYSCALKLSTPITVISAIKEARSYEILVKGGKFLEQVAKADTIVFDKTGTLTEARPVVNQVISFNELSDLENLRIAACLEEHFPHSMAKAVVSKAKEEGLTHEEMHSKPEYIIAHGIASYIGEKRVCIGSYHFIFEDEKVVIPSGKQELFDAIPHEHSRLYMSIDGQLAAVICIEDPLRKEAPFVVSRLKELGFSNVVMMTGDSDKVASVIAKEVGVDSYYSEVLPQDKAAFVEQEKAKGHTVIMIGDGINDSVALSSANCGIAVSDGAELARDIADVVIGTDSLEGILTLKELSNGLMVKIEENYHKIMRINSSLILAGIFGMIPPAAAAFLHNSSTIAISVASMKNILEEENKHICH